MSDLSRAELTSAAGADFLRRNGLPPAPAGTASLDQYWQGLPWTTRDQSAWTRQSLEDALTAFAAAARPAGAMPEAVRLQISPGRGKDGGAEAAGLDLNPGDVVAVVGPTGSGKSRLLADIECLAQGDTPSRRVVQVDGARPDWRTRFTAEGRLVAQITQNMNFVMDLKVADFLALHAEARGLDDTDAAATRVLNAAVGLAGEAFDGTTALTQLSGGQSRALMIADAALLSPKPIVLIDEIENAGIDRARALKLFTDKGKIVLLSTHDPLLALSAGRRVVIGGGAIRAVLATSAEEAEFARALAGQDSALGGLREALRHGHDLAPAWGGVLAAAAKLTGTETP